MHNNFINAKHQTADASTWTSAFPAENDSKTSRIILYLFAGFREFNR